MQALADFARHRPVGCAVCLEQKVGSSVDLDRAEAAFGVLRAADAILGNAGEASDDGHERTLSDAVNGHVAHTSWASVE